MPGGRPTIRSRQVTSELRRLREGVGLTTGEVARRLGISQAKVSRVETGASGMRPDDVAAMLGLYCVPAERREEIMALVREAAAPGWIQIHRELPVQWATLIEWEPKATEITKYEPFMVPGLLQTPDYAREIIASTAETELDESEVDAKVRARLGRQQILGRRYPPQFTVLLHEAALLTVVGGAEVHAAQLRHLVEAARRPRVELRVVPFAAGPHPGLEGGFTIMTFPRDPALINVENRAVSIFLEEDLHIERYRLAWQRVLAAALSPRRSAELIARHAHHLTDTVRSET